MDISGCNDPRQVKVIALLMIRNESRIIKRCIDSCLKICDAVLVEDTGSTDNTVVVLREFLGTLPVPTRLVESSWINFGKSRSASFVSCQKFCSDLGWDGRYTYALAVDADMVVMCGEMPVVDLKKKMTVSGYSLVQKAGTLHYINMRLMRLSDPWKCIGATHEYWDLPPGESQGQIDSRLLYIDDRNDGGCKSDKYERDRRLLIEDLVHSPDNPRTAFYLAQTYKCLRNWKDSIKMYKRRIRIGGWFEEVWFSHYMIAWNYVQLGEFEKAELWVQRAQKYNSYRAEALYMLVRLLREKCGAYWKAWHYLQEARKVKKPDTALFLESEVYEWGLDFETVMLLNHVSPVKSEGLIECIKYLMRSGCMNFDTVYKYIENYVETPNIQTIVKINPPDYGEYCASSVSGFIRKKDNENNAELLVRYVNYECSRKSKYTARSSDRIVRTKNLFRGQLLDNDPPLADLKAVPTNIEGLEDMRIYQMPNDTIGFLATSIHFSNKFRIVQGRIENRAVAGARVIEPPTNTDCEKNWLMCPDGERVIYSWGPFKWGRIVDNRLVIVKEYNTPDFCKHMRGSANPVEVGDDELWCLTHMVLHGEPRRYFHMIVVLDKETLKPVRISMPFYFREIGVEYCMFMDVRLNENKIHFISSLWDKDPAEIVVDINSFIFIGN